MKNGEQHADGLLEKARFEYCAKLFEREAERKEALEKKAQFYLSIVTLALGAIFFKIDFLKGVHELMGTPAASMIRPFVYVSMIVLGFGLLYTLVAVLASMRLQSYKNEHPANIVTSLFSPDSDYLVQRSIAELHNALAMSYALAVESNKKVNDRKAVWVRQSSYGILVTATALAVFLAAITILYLKKG